MIYERTDYDPARHLVLFIHIRKTGGSSLGAQLADALAARGAAGGYRRLRMQGVETYNQGWRRAHEHLRRRLQHLRDEARERGRALLGLPNLALDSVAVASGHVRVDSIGLRRREPLMITLVREPVDRLVSEYFFTRDRVAGARRLPGSEKKKQAWARSFEDYAQMLLERRDALPLNGQCLYFSREGSFEAARRVIDERFLLAGRTQDMARFTQLLGAKLGIPMGPPRRVNKGRSRPEGYAPPAWLRARLEEAMADDMALYEHVGREFAALDARITHS
ncbi:sulfotransferase family 2 domain-containing protein [Oceanicella actignis]|uniref:sulfotransferase family 2 domain-containing protein n=1 Tax=Oceanicella actignis TaxID=1189325 RepID=UPI0011E68493|nr:sulfotransferase family 2 domain-containing protein [Oceanicella actignis]TYO89458.1 sulfotransferase family protein [Oceanicella actignis]